MTPDEVVARAKELVGTEVLLTVRGGVHSDGVRIWLPGLTNPHWIADYRGALLDLIDIRPAPVRIVDGALYRNSDGDLFRGDRDGGLIGFDGYVHPDEIRHDSDLKPVRVVDQ